MSNYLDSVEDANELEEEYDDYCCCCCAGECVDEDCCE